MGFSQEERKVEDEKERKLIPTLKSFRLETGFEPTTYCFSHEYTSDSNNLAS
jgi:hypothetical protein